MSCWSIGDGDGLSTLREVCKNDGKATIKAMD